uniref:Uncharacterized protein n=1 Tax=Leersia perrieri TaxID=77586 RepID=A0A0D9W9L2_9ORYZ
MEGKSTCVQHLHTGETAEFSRWAHNKVKCRSKQADKARRVTEAMAWSRRRDLGRPLLLAFCVAALLAVGSDSHGLEDFGEGKTEATPAMASFFGAKPEAAQLPEALDAAATAKPEAASAIPVATTTASASSSSSSSHGRRSVSVAAGVACGVAAVAVVGVAVAVAYAVRARRGGARRETEVRLGSSP